MTSYAISFHGFQAGAAALSAEVPHPFATAGPLAHGRLGEASAGATKLGWDGFSGQQSYGLNGHL